MWHDLNINGQFTIDDKESQEQIIASGILSGTSRHSNRLQTIRYVYEKYGRLIDPHTADGFFVAQKHANSGTPMICLETALPIKFSETVFESVGVKPIPPKAFLDIENKPQRIKKIQLNSVELKKFIYSKVKDR